MSDYVPTTEDVRADYAETYEGTDERRYAGFDAWLAAHDAEVAAKALEDVANEYDARLPDGTGNGREYNSYTVARTLRARAAEYRKAVQ